MDELGIEHRLTEIEQRSKSNSHRLDKLEPIISEIHTMSKTMVQLVGEVQHTNENVSEIKGKINRMDNRVDEMEMAPADEAKKYKMAAITAIISTIFGALATGVIILIAQYI